MDEFKSIEDKLIKFTKKQYTNELIRGSVLFLSFGFLFFFVVAFIEYFLWLAPFYRTLLFWVFILIEVFLLVRYIMHPISKLLWLKKSTLEEDAPLIIGRHFPQIQDKLLNLIQLKNTEIPSELLIASISQKAIELKPYSFVKAIPFKKNLKYLKYILAPLFIWVLILLTGNNVALNNSLQRLVNHSQPYLPPAPFSFNLLNTDLNVIKGDAFTIKVSTSGDVIPEEVKIIFNQQEYFLQTNSQGVFSFTFPEVTSPISFIVSSNKVTSIPFTINVINTPTIESISLSLQYPKYLKKKSEIITNKGAISVPYGTNIIWTAKTSQTDSLNFIYLNKREAFKQVSTSNFTFNKRIMQGFQYEISSSNSVLKDYESLPFSIQTIPDNYPSISVISETDSITNKSIDFFGNISDDYGLTKLELHYYDVSNPLNVFIQPITISKNAIQTFYYTFPSDLKLNPGSSYELFFKVYDNDGVKGVKYSKSNLFSYRLKTEDELKNQQLESQQNAIENIASYIKEKKRQENSLQSFQQNLKKKTSANWNDKKKIDAYLKKEQRNQQQLRTQTKKLSNTLENLPSNDERSKLNKQQLLERINELNKQDKQQKLLDEIEKLANKLNKEDLLESSKKLSQQNKQSNKNLERMLELVKRFYVEQKTLQFSNKLFNFSKQQDSIISNKSDSVKAQKQLNSSFTKAMKEFDELLKENESLKEPLSIPDIEIDLKDIDNDLSNALEEATQPAKPSLQQHQKGASKKMKDTAMRLQKSMEESQGKSIEANTDDLRKILDNLILFSFQQEDLMNRLYGQSAGHPNFNKDLKKQQELKSFFEHIDDSLYVLSMRVPEISTKIEENLSDAHYHLNQSLENLSENLFSQGTTNQQYILTSTNSLSHYLSNILNSMKNNMSLKKGKGKSGEFSLPDLIKKQGELTEQMKKGLKGKQSEQTKQGEQGKPSPNGKKGTKSKGGGFLMAILNKKVQRFMKFIKNKTL